MQKFIIWNVVAFHVSITVYSSRNFMAGGITFTLN